MLSLVGQVDIERGVAIQGYELLQKTSDEAFGKSNK